MAKETTTKKASTKSVHELVPHNPIYTIESAAAVLHCSTRTLADKFREGDIKAYKKLGQWYTLHGDLVAYLQG